MPDLQIALTKYHYLSERRVNAGQRHQCEVELCVATKLTFVEFILQLFGKMSHLVSSITL